MLADPTRLRQVLVNLLGNAFKFTKHGEIVLLIERRGAYWHFEVQDSGIGMSAAQLAMVFATYCQADVETSRKFGGTGLGLSICKQLVTLMGGEIGVDSTPGQGTRFWFEVPFDVLPDSVNARADMAGPDSPLRGCQLLLVADNPTLAQLLGELAVEWGMLLTSMPRSALLLPPHPQLCDGRFEAVCFDQYVESDTTVTEALSTLQYLGTHTPILLLCHGTEQSLPPPEAEHLMEGWSHARLVLKPACTDTYQTLFFELINGVDRPSSSHWPKSTSEPVLRGESLSLRVLVVDDNETNLTVICAMLRKLNCLATAVADGQQALQQLMARPLHFDLVLMDCEMPVLDGWQATEKLRVWELEQAVGHHLVVALTAHCGDFFSDKCRVAGMDDLLSKPVKLVDLQRQLQEVSGQKNYLATSHGRG